MVAKVRERLAVSKQTGHKFVVERFNFRKLNELEISNRFAALENINDSEDTYRAWENIKYNIKNLLKVSRSI
jgi:hypothetical protein